MSKRFAKGRSRNLLMVAFGFAVLALLWLSVSLGSVFSAPPQGKGGEIVAKPTPKKTATPKRTPTTGNRRRTGSGNTTATDAQHETLTNRIGMEFVWVPPGSFMMGSENGGAEEKPIHKVTFVVYEDASAMARSQFARADAEAKLGRTELIRLKALIAAHVASQAEYDAAQVRYNLAKLKVDALRTTTGGFGFYMGKYEVTQSQWQTVMGNSPSYFKDCGNCPVERVSWQDVQEFLDELNDRNDGFRYRLPTEAEWEYACRGGTTGDYAGDLDNLAWYATNSGNRTHRVGTKQPNAFGLFDMHGNVWEWCLDWFHPNYQGAPTDGRAWISESEQRFFVIRGGGYNDDKVSVGGRLRSAYRGGDVPGDRTEVVGFRVVAIARD